MSSCSRTVSSDGGWRMASEDSREPRDPLLAIHRLGRSRAMSLEARSGRGARLAPSTAGPARTARSRAAWRSQWMLFEERNDPSTRSARRFTEKRRSARWLSSALSMIVPHPKNARAASSAGSIRSRLVHRRTRAGPASRADDLAIAHDRDREAPSPSTKPTTHWLERPRPFLLIVRTGRIFTAHDPPYEEGVTMNEYRRIHGVSSI